ncbi:MAG: DUF3999 domain-containing protein [Rhodocyclaceae bacterium]|nr:DUF3999 domain-containing protein [Rhodocyclaceae bacterium]
MRAVPDLPGARTAVHAALRCCAALAAAGMALCAAHASPVPDDYAYSIPVTAPGHAPFYRYALPDAVYADVRRSDLGDLAMFNARGEAVAFALRPPPPDRQNSPMQRVPLFALPEDRGAAARPPIQVELAPDGQVAKVLAPLPAGRANRPPSTYLADLTGFSGVVASLEIEWKTGTTALNAGMDVEASDDLRSWRVLVQNAPLLQLSAGGAELRRAHIDFAPESAKYLRLRYVGPVNHGEISALRVQAAPVTQAPARRWKTLAGSSHTSAQYEFDPEGRYPVDRLRIHPAAQNEVVPVSILVRTQAGKPWRLLAHSVAYRLHREAGESYAPDIELRLEAGSHIALRADSGNFAGAPTVTIGWVAQEVVFAAQGPGPYQLAYGSLRAGPVALPITSLVPGYDGKAAPGITIAHAGTGAPRFSGTPAVLRPAPPWRTWTLWGSLALAVGVLAAMAWRIARGLPDRNRDGD